MRALGLLAVAFLFEAWSLRSAEIAGITEPYLDATLSTPVAGTIGKHYFKEGDFVSKGQPIVDLDRRLEELEVARRQAILENATAILKRTEELASKTRSVTQEELDKHRAEQRVAQAELDFAREQLRRRQVSAPFNGVVVDLFGLDVGEGCQPQAPLVRLVDTRRCWFVVNLESRVVQRIHLGQRLALSVGAVTGRHNLEAVVQFISPVADPASGLVKVKALFENPEAKVVAGDTATLKLSDE